MSSDLSVSRKSNCCSCFGKPKTKKPSIEKTTETAQKGPPFATTQDISLHLSKGGLPPQTYKHVRALTGHPNHPKEKYTNSKSEE